MAVTSQTASRFRTGDQIEADTAASLPGNVDALVSDFLQELTGLSAGIPPVRQSGVEAERPAQDLPVFEAATALEPALPERATIREIFSEPELNIAEIDKEIDATLTELERRRPAVVPISDRMDAAREPAASPAKAPEQPVAASAPPQTAKPVAAPPARKIEMQEWNRLEIFRTELAYSKKTRRWKIIYYILTAALLLAILILFLFNAFDGIIQGLGPAPVSNSDRSVALEMRSEKINHSFPFAG